MAPSGLSKTGAHRANIPGSPIVAICVTKQQCSGQLFSSNDSKSDRSPKKARFMNTGFLHGLLAKYQLFGLRWFCGYLRSRCGYLRPFCRYVSTQQTISEGRSLRNSHECSNPNLGPFPPKTKNRPITKCLLRNAQRAQFYVTMKVQVCLKQDPFRLVSENARRRFRQTSS